MVMIILLCPPLHIHAILFITEFKEECHMKCLIVIDMQEDYVGSQRNQSRYPYQVDILIHNINKKIATYAPNHVIYVNNKFFWERKQSEKKSVEGLAIVSKHIFEKRKASCFTNQLINLLQELNVKEIELVGVDGNYYVRASALVGRKSGFNILFNETCIGASKPLKFKKTRNILANNGIAFTS